MTIVNFLLFNAVVGLLLFEWSWFKTRRVREVDEARDSLFPSWRRLDAKYWSKLQLYPAAITIMPLKIYLYVALLSITAIGFGLIFIGVDVTKKVPAL